MGHLKTRFQGGRVYREGKIRGQKADDGRQICYQN